jgi:hypothetical protein
MYIDGVNKNKMYASPVTSSAKDGYIHANARGVKSPERSKYRKSKEGIMLTVTSVLHT